MYFLPYFCLSLLLIFFSFQELKNTSNKRTIQILEGFIVTIFFGCRGFIGSDWSNYYNAYYKLLDKNYEPFYSLLSDIFFSLGLDYFYFQFFLTIIIILLFDRYLKNKVPCLGFCYIILLSSFPVLIIDSVRNTISILLALHAIDLYKEHNYLRSIIIGVSSLMFHTTGIIFLIFIPFFNKFIPKRILLTLFILGLGVYLLQISYIKPIISIVASLLGSKIEAIATLYLNNDQYSASYGLSFGMLGKIFIFWIFLLKYDYITKNYLITPFMSSLFTFYVLGCLFLSEMTILINRFVVLFSIGYICVVANIPFYFIRKSTNRLIVVLIILLSLLKISISYNREIYSYSNVLFTKDSYYQRLDILENDEP